MKKVLIAALLLVFCVLPSTTVHAINPLDEACSKVSGEEKPTACKESGSQNPLYGPGSLLNNITNGIALLGGAIAVIYMILAGYKMITSSGDSQSFGQARSSIIYGAVGLVVIVVARYLIAFVLARLG